MSKINSPQSALASQLESCRQAGLEISLKAGADIHALGQTTFIDVRESDELEGGIIAGAIWIPRGRLEVQLPQLIPLLSTPLVLYCESGTRSLLATASLTNLGYDRTRSLAGGFGAWSRAGSPIAKKAMLTTADRKRYQRHLVIPEVGEVGQARLLAAKVLIIGAGGLGSPAAYYLAAAGVGTIALVDHDTVEDSNLQRQILHAPDRVGQLKTTSAATTLKAFSPSTQIDLFSERLTSANVDRIFSPYDIIVDGTDNFPSRYLINDAALKHKKPCVHGSVYRFDGQVSVFDPARGGPCYRCLYPKPPPAAAAPSCAEAGVLGVLPGVIGLLQAVETVKLILQKGDLLVGRLLAYEALGAHFREFRLHQDPTCGYCASVRGERDFPGYIDYEAYCKT